MRPISLVWFVGKVSTERFYDSKTFLWGFFFLILIVIFLLISLMKSEEIMIKRKITIKNRKNKNVPT